MDLTLTRIGHQQLRRLHGDVHQNGYDSAATRRDARHWHVPGHQPDGRGRRGRSSGTGTALALDGLGHLIARFAWSPRPLGVQACVRERAIAGGRRFGAAGCVVDLRRAAGEFRPPALGEWTATMP